MDINDIYKSVKPLKNRIHINMAVISLFTGLTAAGGLSFILAYLALAIPIPFLLKTIIIIYVTAVTASLVVSIFLRPGNLKVFKVADSLGLKERLITAYELREDRHPLSRIQRYDALKAVSKADFKSLYAIRFPKYQGLASLALALLIAMSFAIPAPSREKAAGIESLLADIKKQAEKVDQERKELSKKANLSDKELREVNKKIDQLLKELKDSRTESEALKALSKTKHELEALKNKELNDDLRKLGEKLSENPLTRDFGQSLQNGNMAEMRDRLSKLNEKLKTLNANQKKELAEAFKNAAKEIANNKDLAQNLANLGQALASGNLGSISDQLADINSTLSEMAESDSELADAIQQLSNSMDEARNQIASRSSGGNKSAQTSAQGNSGQQANTPGNGSTEGNGNQKGQGNSNGSKSQKGGGGAGNQSSNGDLGYSGDETGGGAKKPGEKKSKDYESIYVPRRLGGDAEESQIKGRKNNSGTSQWQQASNAPVEKGDTVPYDQVLGNYRNEAMSGLQDNSIPPVMKDIVRDYFSSLE